MDDEAADVAEYVRIETSHLGLCFLAAAGHILQRRFRVLVYNRDAATKVQPHFLGGDEHNSTITLVHDAEGARWYGVEPVAPPAAAGVADADADAYADVLLTLSRLTTASKQKAAKVGGAAATGTGKVDMTARYYYNNNYYTLPVILEKVFELTAYSRGSGGTKLSKDRSVRVRQAREQAAQGGKPVARGALMPPVLEVGKDGATGGPARSGTVDVMDDVALLLETGTKAKPVTTAYFGRVHSAFVRVGHRDTRKRCKRPLDMGAPPNGAEVVCHYFRPVGPDLKEWELIEGMLETEEAKKAGYVDARAYPLASVFSRVAFQRIVGQASRYTANPEAVAAAVTAAADKTRAAAQDEGQRKRMAAEARRRMLANQHSEGYARPYVRQRGQPRRNRGVGDTLTPAPDPAPADDSPPAKAAAAPPGKAAGKRLHPMFAKCVQRPVADATPVSVVDLDLDDAELHAAIFAQNAPMPVFAGIVLTVDDLRTAAGTCWLNDHVIKAYFACIVATDHDGEETFKKMYAFSTYFWTLYSNNQHDPGRMKTWGRKHIDWTGGVTETVLLPVHWPGHWALGIIDVLSRKIHYLDSSPNTHRRATFMRHALAYCNYKVGADGSHFTSGHLKSSVQTDGCACGVFTCINAAEYVAGNAPDIFSKCTQESVPQHRMDIVVTVYRAAAAAT